MSTIRILHTDVNSEITCIGRENSNRYMSRLYGWVTYREWCRVPRPEGWWRREGLREDGCVSVREIQRGSPVAPGVGGRNVPRPVLTASRPSQTMAQMGPLSMSASS